MPKTNEPCDTFRPGRNLPHNECECGWMRIDHATKNVPPVVFGQQPVDEVESINQISIDRNYYRMLLIQIGEMFGKAAHIAGDGTYQRDVIVEKVPDLVRELLTAKGFKSARLPFPPPAMPVPSEQKVFLDAVATTGAKASVETVQIARTAQTLYADNEQGDTPAKE